MAGPQVTLRCPRCSTMVQAEADGRPVCPSCGFGGTVARKPPAADPPAGTAASPPAPAAAPPQGSAPVAPAPPQGPTSGLAIAALVLGICSFVFLALYGIGFLMAVAAIVTGAMGMQQTEEGSGVQGRAMAITGLALGIANVVLSILVALLLLAFFGAIFGAFA